MFNINTLGSAGEALKVNSSGSGIEFGSSGGLVLLNTTDVTSATATVTFDNTLITDTYDIYQLSYTNIDPVTDGVSLRGRLSTDNGGSFIATAYKTGYYYNKLVAVVLVNLVLVKVVILVIHLLMAMMLVFNMVA